MPAFAAASYCFYEDEDESHPIAKKIATFTIGQLAQLLYANTRLEYKKHALIQIGKRALDPSNADQLFAQGAIDATISCLKSEDEEVLELATKALINISVDETSRDDIYDGGGIPLLVKLLQDANENVQANAAWALINLTNNEANKGSVREVPEAIPCLVSLSQLTANSSLQSYALKVLANLSESPENQKMMADIAILVPLFKVLVTSRNMSLISYILYFFRNLTKSDEGRAAVRAAAGLKVFIHLLKNYRNPQVLGPVLVVLTNIADQDNIIEMLKLGVLQQFIPILQQGQDLLLVIIFTLLQKIASDARTHKLLVKVLCEISPERFLIHQQPKVHTAFIQLIQILVGSELGFQELHTGGVLVKIVETLSTEQMTDEAQETIMTVLLNQAKTPNKSILCDDSYLAAFIAKASSENLTVQQRALHLMAILAIDPDVRIKIAKLGGLNKLLAILADPEDHPVILTLALVAMNVMLVEARLRNIVIKTRRLQLSPLLQSTEPQVVAAAQKLLQSLRAALQNERNTAQEVGPQQTRGSAAKEQEAEKRTQEQTKQLPGDAMAGVGKSPEAMKKGEATEQRKIDAPARTVVANNASHLQASPPRQEIPKPIVKEEQAAPSPPESREVGVNSPESTPTPLLRRVSSLLSDGITYKINYGPEVKVVRVAANTTWSDLQGKIFSKFPALKPAELSLKYKDQSGDLITLETDEDLEFALELFDKAASGAAIQIFLVRKQEVVATLRHRKQQFSPDNPQGSQSKNITDLSKDLTIRIFSYLPGPKDLACASMTCRVWSTYLNDQAIWKDLFQRLHKNKPPPSTAQPSLPASTQPTLPSLLATPISMSLENLRNLPPKDTRPRREPKQKVGSANWKELLLKEQKGNELMSMHFQGTKFLQEHAEPVTGVQFHSSGSYFFSCSFDGTTKVWETGTGAVVNSVKAHIDIVSCLSIQDKYLCTGSWDRTVKVWESQGQRIGRCTSTLKHDGKVHCLRSSPSHIFSGGSDKQVRVWDPQRGEMLQALKGHTSDISSLAYNRQDETLFSGGNRPVLVWDLATGKNIATLTGHSGEVNCIQADSTRILSGSWDKNVKLWDPRSWLCEQTMRAHTWPVRCLQYDEDQNLLVTGSSDKTVKVWDLRMFGECLNTLEGHTNFVCCLSFVGSTLVSGSDDCTIRLWDLSL